MSKNNNKATEQCTLHSVSCFYLVYVDVDYEGIKEDMMLFNTRQKAEEYAKNENENGEWCGIGEYKVKELNCN
jgi:hypothetical protein